ncbi:uncharacterized protein LOC141600623 [Silene latifolia]|uniref:uncharacterized protein LOC141600623 n=1 Tax=Silene latifolia TaxID=37657 RepID=UPI003D789C26
MRGRFNHYLRSTGFRYFAPVARNTPEWDAAKRIIHHIALEFAEEMDNHPKYPLRLLKAGRHCSGTYSVYFRAKGADRVTATYTAEGWVDSDGSCSDNGYFYKVDGSETRERKNRSRKTNGKTKTNEKACESKEEHTKSTTHTGCDEAVSDTPALVTGETSGNLRSRAFYLVAAEIRNQRPYLEYPKVKKLASCKWRTLSDNVASFGWSTSDLQLAFIAI